jgi:dihydroorotate dehydrogenase (NAD+) catalytic subunit
VSGSVSLSIDCGAGLTLKNPVLTASGTFGYGIEFQPYLELSALGGFVTKGISPRSRGGNAPARIVETPSGMLNAIGLQNVGVDRFIEENLPLMRGSNTAIVVNVFGTSVEDYVFVTERLEQAEGVTALELNLSCPNVHEGGLEIGRSAHAIEQVTRAVRNRTAKPLWVKLTPNVSDIAEMGRAAVAGGADALSLVNTYVGMVIDIERRAPVLSHKTGGLSGPAIRPLAIAAVYQVAKALPKVPLCGIGGIVSARDVVEYLMAGASCVQVGTANFNDPSVATRVVTDLEQWCQAHGVTDVRQLVRAAHD